MTLGSSTFCLVRLYKNSAGTGAYIDLDDIQGPKLKYVENYGVTGSLTIVNDIGSSSRNLLSSSCTLWSSGSGALKPGMFLHIWQGSRTNANKLGVFIITQISPSDDLIDVTFGDCIQILRATGADYHRNHYAEGQQHTNEEAYGAWDSSAERIYVEKPSDVTIDAANGDVQWAVSEETELSTSGGNGFLTSDGYIETEFDLDADYLIGFTLRPQPGLDGLNCRMRIYVNGVLRQTQTVVTNASDQYFEFSTPLEGNTIRIRLDQPGNQYGTSDGVPYYSGANLNWAPSTYSQGGISNSTLTIHNYWNSQEIVYETRTEQHTSFFASIVTASYAYATAGEQDPSDRTKYYITAIEGLSSITQMQGDPAWTGRALITYLEPGGDLLMSTIFSRICDAAGMDATVVTSARAVGIFRCGGDYYHNYLLALADMDEPSGTYAGRQHGIAASTTSWGDIRLGIRYRANDSSQATLYYAGDGERSGIPMMAFVPSLTLQYRPYLAVTKGTKDDGTPIIVAVRDPDVDIGSASSIVDGSVTTIEDAALSSYSEIITNRSTNWEGTVQLSGIYTDFMVVGTYTGGVPVRIYDSRYGMSGYAARVREVELNFTEQTTTLYLNNYSEMYANSIIDSTKMAYSAGNLAVEASSSDLFTKQYVRLESTATLSSRTNHTIEIYSSENGYESATADVLEISDLDIAVLSAYFPRGISTITEQYGITRVRVDGSTVINIPEAIRPDKYSNQSLIVNVQMNI